MKIIPGDLFKLDNRVCEVVEYNKFDDWSYIDSNTPHKTIKSNIYPHDVEWIRVSSSNDRGV